MKIQYLAVVFIIIMLPISLVFSEYISAQVETVSLQISFDTKLDNATYDAIKAFQINTINNATSDLADSKIRDIEAAANAFYKSIGTSFNMVGYDTESLSNYVPALVFTLYDGFYIHSQFENTLDDETMDNIKPGSTYDGTEGQILGLKPYISYSCRYQKGNIDVTITYSLDNYITVQGIDASGDGINIAGYLISNISNSTENSIRYRDVTIEKEPALTQQLYQDDSSSIRYIYTKINGQRYYKQQGTDNKWFYISNNRVETIEEEFSETENDMAYRYYKEALEFRDALETAGITSLTPDDAVDENGDPLTDAVITNADGEVIYSFMEGPNSNQPIFDYGTSKNNAIELPDSKFNEHRLAVIRYIIEKNLSVALANYNNGTYDFRMPKLSEEDWATIMNNVSLISFLQGISIGGKIYNGYSVINNNKNEEVVTENSIYIIDDPTDSSGHYHRITHKGLNSYLSSYPNAIGMFNIEFERRSIERSASERRYYYPYRQLGCYDCYVLQTGNETIDTDSNIYEYVDSCGNRLAKLYYTALGRERYSMYKIYRTTDFIQQFYKNSP